MTAPCTAAHGMVASSQRLASAVGVELLRQGGSAVDAAIGVNAMLSLIEPHMCGPGGDLFALVWEPRERRLYGLNASGRAPRGQTLAALRTRLGAGAAAIPATSVHAVTAPGAVRGWQALHGRFGRLPRAAVFEAAIGHAERGVEIGPVTAHWWQHCVGAVLADGSIGHLGDGLRATFKPGGEVPAAGATFANAALARTYAALARDGFDDFYEGRLARELAAYLEACGAALDGGDLAVCRAEWVNPITTCYRGYDVYELPPNGQGLAVLQMLNLLERFPLGAHDVHSADYWHWFVEAKKLAFEDRARFYADPQAAAVPVAALASKAYAARRAVHIGARANAEPCHGDPVLSAGDTTYLTVADADGMMVSLIQSIYHGFGSGLVAPGLGFALQCRGAGFSLDAAHPNVYAPGKRPFHTIIPGFVFERGEPLLSFGVMGGDMQPQGQVEVLVNVLDFGMDIAAAGAAPRLRHDGENHPHLTRPPNAGCVRYEAACNAGMIEALRERGHDVQPAHDPVQHFMGGYQCIRRTAEGWSGASEPRFDGCAAGY